ncbi:PREDICTED: uncharacterized protein LOC104606390 isoform X2 [Nelumbo nucifera]|uniref:Uncharacterized protein LOC104606390 isoform X2 n=1 Tax=Nelumbo nucifera TaxID=4432 RepID=A0A1U8AQD7_NELNU|nr:PREDICTED: uncharacterized protein LOC104606390 isoform X2 [Nelumbo nucifera]
MEGNVHQAPPLRSSDPTIVQCCGRTEIRTTSDLSRITNHNCGRFVGDEKVIEPMLTQWTDEKHRLYLNFMEALFVKDLYNHKYDSMDTLGLHPQKENPSDHNTSLYSSANTPTGQFNVLRDGSWQKLNFERAQPQSGNAGKSHVLLENSWIQHFRSAGKSPEVVSATPKENSSLHSHTFHLRGKKAASSGEATSSKQLSPCQFDMFHREYVGNSTEVSDQNFVDEVTEEENLSGPCRTKRMKTGIADVSRRDQVVPFGESYR